MTPEEVETVRAFGTTGTASVDASKDPLKPGTEPRVSSLAIVYGLTLGALAIAALVTVYRNGPIAFAQRDPLATLQAHPLTGVLSNVGALVWCALITAWYLVRFRGVILASTWGVLFTALTFSALSLAVDALQDSWSSPGGYCLRTDSSCSALSAGAAA